MTYEKALEDAGVNRAQAAAHAQGLADLHADFLELRFEIIQWIVGMSLVQTTLTVALIKVLI